MIVSPYTCFSPCWLLFCRMLLYVCFEEWMAIHVICVCVLYGHIYQLAGKVKELLKFLGLTTKMLLASMCKALFCEVSIRKTTCAHFLCGSFSLITLGGYIHSWWIHTA